MDREKNRFLFGVDAPNFRVDDVDELVDFFEDDWDMEFNTYQLPPELLAVVASRILSGDTSSWSTAQRLMEGGLDRREALEQVAFALRHELVRAGQATSVDPDGRPDIDESLLSELFESLPLADAEESIKVIAALAAERPLRHAEDYPAAVLERLGRLATAPLLVEQVEYDLDAGVEAGVLRYLPDDKVVSVPTLTAGIVLTHRLRDDEIKLDSLTFVASDLCGFSWHGDLTLDRSGLTELEPGSLDPTAFQVIGAADGVVLWKLPEETLEGCSIGDIVSVRIDALGAVTIDRIDDPSPSPALVDAIRSAYESETAELDMAIDLGDLLTTVLASDPEAFSEPQLPLTELCVAAGLEVRGSDVGDSPEAWAGLSRAQRGARVFRASNEHAACAESAEEVLEWFDLVLDDDDQMRSALKSLGEDHVAELVVDELIDPDGVSRDSEHARNVGERLVAVARRGPEFAAAFWMLGVIEERIGNPHEAERCFAKGLSADPTSMPLIDRLGWYASDRGDAAAAVRLFQRLDDDQGEGRAIAAFAKSSRSGLGRNDPCWCGSGRKYKACHLGVVEQASLPDRVGWIVHKAFAYLRRHGGEAVGAIVVAAAAWAGDDIDSVREALDDPIVFDTVLTEGGWWRRFLDDRGPLLPADEFALIERWLTVQRGVYEVVEVHRGGGVDVRDFRTGEQIALRAGAESAAVRVGDVLLARAVPDGEGHQFVAAVHVIPESRRDFAMSLCDDADGDAICAFVGALNPR